MSGTSPLAGGVIEGEVLEYEADDVNTDVIWPGKYTYVQVPPEEMPRYAMETFDPRFQERLAGKSVLVVGRNFGCGSSREQASECLLRSGVRLIVARSFARIFYRNSLNLGLPVVELPAAVDALATGDRVRVDLGAGALSVLSAGQAERRFAFPPFPAFLLELLADGGLIENIRKRSPAP